MNIDKAKNNYNKEGRPKCFNCNKYRYMVKKYRKKKEKNPRKCFRYKKTSYIVKDCKEKQPMKIRSIQKDLEDKDKEKDFGKDPEQAWYKRSMYLIPKINILFLIKGTIRRRN